VRNADVGRIMRKEYCLAKRNCMLTSTVRDILPDAVVCCVAVIVQLCIFAGPGDVE